MRKRNLMKIIAGHARALNRDTDGCAAVPLLVCFLNLDKLLRLRLSCYLESEMVLWLRSHSYSERPGLYFILFLTVPFPRSLVLGPFPQRRGVEGREGWTP